MNRIIQFEEETLTQMKKRYQTIASDWNGKDTTFHSGGIQYTEDQAQIATDIVDALENVENLIDTFNF